MKRFSVFLSLLMCFCVSAWAQDSSETPELIMQAQTRPNIVFIFTDDLGYGDVGAFGADDIKTPHIDSLASNGVKFTQFYSASPVCTPSRAGLLTGRYPVRMGIHHVFFPGSYYGMPPSEITLAEVLKASGYATGMVGKWHLGHHEQFLPLNQGFESFFGIPYSNDMLPLPMMRGNAYVEDRVDQTQLTRRLTEQSVSFIEANAEQPFFLYMAHPMPHVPLYRSETFEGKSERGIYGDVIEELDWSVGQILSALEANGLADKTLVVFTSDNGPWLVMGKKGGSSGTLRNGKGTTFEGGIRMPTLAQYPNKIQAGTVVETPAIMLDWFPTLVSLAGGEIPYDRHIDGQDISGLWTEGSDAPKDRVLAFYSHGQLEAIRKGNWKLKRPYDTKTIPLPGILKVFLKGEVGLRSHATLLFDLSNDPEEQNTLANENPEKVIELQKVMKTFESELGALPPSITETQLEINPSVQVLIGATIKLLLIVLSVLLLVIAVVFFFLGRRSRRKTRS